jgi:hypothetical protein
MGVVIDKTRADYEATGIDHCFGVFLRKVWLDRDDAVSNNSNVSFESGPSSPINDSSPA